MKEENLHTSYAELAASIRSLYIPYEECLNLIRKIVPSVEIAASREYHDRVGGLIVAYRVSPATEKEAEFRMREANRAKEKLLASEGRKASKVLLFDALSIGIDPLAYPPEELAFRIKELQQWAIESCAVCGRAIMKYPYCDRCKKDTTVVV